MRGARTPLALAALTLATTPPMEAGARTDLVLPYSVGEVWPSAVRFLRIDRSYVVKEKDEPSGYILFELDEGKRTYRGAVELVRRRDDDGREATRIGITIPDLPRHFEQALLDKLAQKVRDDYGAPAPPPRRPAPKAPPDAGAPRR
jgi:hypothetical protein